MCNIVKFHTIVLIFLSFNSYILLSSSGPIESEAAESYSSVVEVPYGSTITLTCGSNDESHNFFYWHKVNDKNFIVGPGNPYKNGKFQYEILSGNLTIKSATKYEEGTYQCVSRGVRKDDINIREVRMVVQQDWEDVYEHDSGVNLFRILVILITIMIIAGVAYGGYRIWKNRLRNPHYLVPTDDEEEDSGDEIFRAPRTSSSSANLIQESFADDDFKNGAAGISTDFKSILDTANNK